MKDKRGKAEKAAGDAVPGAGGGVSRSAARKRRRLIGANVTVAVVLAASLLVAVNVMAWWLTDRYDLTADVTSDSTHSLSTRTRMVLGEVQGKIHLTSLFRAGETDTEAEHRQAREVGDLLRQYERLGNDVEVRQIDPIRETEALATVGRRLTGLYRDETRPYEQLVDDFLAYKTDLAAFFAAQRDKFIEAAALAGEVRLRQELQQIAEFFAAVVSERPVVSTAPNLGQVETGIKMLLGRAGEGSLQDPSQQMSGYGIQYYAQAAQFTAEASHALAEQVKTASAIVERQLREQGIRLSPALRSILEAVPERHQAVELKLVSYADRLAELPPLEIDQLMHRLSLNSILVEAGGRATVVSKEDVYPVVQDGQALNQVFAGEEAVTAALLRLTVQDRPVAMFVKPGGRLISERLPEFKTIVEQLRQSNFVIENWDLSQSSKMPRPESDGPIVLVVMVPDQVNPQLRMPRVLPQEYAPVLEFLERGGDAMFLTRGSLPNQPAAVLPYDHVLRAMGLRVRTDMQTVHRMETTAGQQMATPYLETLEYPSQAYRGSEVHPIIRPLQGLRGRFDWTVPVVAADEQPAGLQWWPLVSTPENAQFWGESDVSGFLQGEEQRFDAESDLPSPFALAVAAVIPREPQPADEGAGQGEWAPEVPGSRRAIEAARRDSEQQTLTLEQAVHDPAETRLVVFGGDIFMRSAYLDSRVHEMRTFPANAELFVNSMFWLSGQEEMIGLGPQAQQSRRLAAMGSSRTAVMWLLWLGMPMAVLLIGGSVWFSRRR